MGEEFCCVLDKYSVISQVRICIIPFLERGHVGAKCLAKKKHKEGFNVEETILWTMSSSISG